MFNIRLKCQKCNEVITIDFNSFIECDSVGCPSCSLSLPDEALQHLQSGLSHFKTAVQGLNLNQEAVVESEWAFGLSIDYITTQ